MGEFRRTQSKVWWGNGMEEPSGEDASPAIVAPESPWGPGVDLSSRGHSVSPSSGSHRSQDSGFSDTEERKESSLKTSSKRSPELTTRNNLGTKNISATTTNKVSNLERETKQKNTNLEIAAAANNSNDHTKVSNIVRYCPTYPVETSQETLSKTCYNFADVRKIFETRAIACPQTSSSKQLNISVPYNSKSTVKNQKRCFEDKDKNTIDYNQTSPPSIESYFENKENEVISRSHLTDIGPETNVDGSSIEKNYLLDDGNGILPVSRSRANSASGSDTSEELRRLTEANGHEEEDEEEAEKDPLASCHSLQRKHLTPTSRGCSIVGCIPKITPQTCSSEQTTELELVTDQFPILFDLTGPFEPPAHQSTPKGHYHSKAQRLGRPVKLIHDFERVNDEKKSRQNLIATGIEVGKLTGCLAVNHWLNELGTIFEPECTVTLQSKALRVTDIVPNADLAQVTRDQVLALQTETRLIGEQFDQLCRQLDAGIMQHVGPLVQSLVSRVSEFCQLRRPPPPTDALAKVTRRCDALRRAAIAANGNRLSASPDRLARMLADLGRAFAVVVDHLLAENIQGMVYTLEQPNNETCMRSALTALSSLSIQGPVLARGIGRAGGVRALLGVCLDSRHATLRATALRALGGVCCVATNIRHLEHCGGVELISEILCDTQRGEIERAEAAAVLAQITAPWVEDNPGVAGLSARVPSVIKALTDLSRETKFDETLLLCTSALANLTSLESSTAVCSLLEHRSAATVLSAVRRRGASASIFLQEQGATLIANMAAVPETRPRLADERAVAALLCFLQPSVNISSTRSAESEAAARVQQKAAIALSRLCSEPTVAEQVVALEGVARLVRLCREDRERYHSDGVLVACLATLRKIAANCGTSAMEELDAMSLVEPRLLDSYLIYSSRQESYV